MRTSRLVFVALATLVLLAGTPAMAIPLLGPAASQAHITVVLSCDDGGYVVTSSKDISSVVVRDVDGADTKTEYDTPVRRLVVPSTDADTIWVKSGNNASGDGPGYGQRFDVDPVDCTDGDSDGVPDDQDNCPDVANQDQADADGDLIGDACDPDADGDGYEAAIDDCDDADPEVNPGAVDVPNNGIDENCDGTDLVVGEGDLSFTLVWETNDDLDIHVIDPNGERVWWQDDTAASGGTLDRDDNVGTCTTDPEPGGVENVFWPEASAIAGTYTAEVYAYTDCDGDGLAGTEWTLTVFEDGVQIDQVTGSYEGAGTPIQAYGVPLGSLTHQR